MDLRIGRGRGPAVRGSLAVRLAQTLKRLVPASVELRVELDDEEMVVSIDPSGLEQVLVNLVMNAGEAIEGRGTVVVRSRGGEKDQVRVEVEDDGVGMTEETRSEIFEPFFTTKEQGTGLGLSTVYGIVIRAGGTFRVESEQGVGTRLAILLPRLPGAAPDARPVGTEAQAKAGRPEARAEVVLVVEDEDTVRRTVERALRRAGYSVAGAADGRSALEIAASRPVDLLLTDVQLPDIQGPELAARMKELLRTVRQALDAGQSSASGREAV